MKKTVGVIVFFVCLICGGLLLTLKVQTNSASTELFLPENVFVFLHLHNFAEQKERFFETSPGKIIQSFNPVELALDLEFSWDTVNFLQKLQNFAFTTEARIFSEEFLSNDCSLALLHDKEVNDYEEYLKENLVLFFEPVHSSQKLDIAIKKLATKYNISSLPYGKHVIYRLKTPTHLMITAAFVGDKALITLDERTLRQMLDRYDTQGSNLSENYFFAGFKKKNIDPISYCYFEISALSYHLENLFKKYSSSPNTTDFLTIWKGFTAGIYSTASQENSFKNTVTLYYNPNNLEADIQYFLNIPPERDIHLADSPRDTLLYFWMNVFDMTRLWDLYVKKSKFDRILVQSIEENIALTAGLPFNDLLDLIGNRVHLIIRKPSSADPVPLPNFTIVFELTNSEKAQTTLQQLFLLNKIPHGNDIYRDIPFTYWGNDMQTGLQPVYSIHDDYLYISSSVKMQLDVINTVHERQGLTYIYSFSSVGQKLLLANNSSGYIKVEQFINFLKKFISLGEAMISRQDKDSAYKTKTIVYEIIFPLLESMKMFSSITMVSNFDQGKLDIEFNFNYAE